MREKARSHGQHSFRRGECLCPFLGFHRFTCALSNISHNKIMDSLISLDAKVSSPWGAFLGLVWSGSQNIWEDGTAWDYQNFGQGHTPYITWICEICERNLATKHLNGCTDQIESANCFKLGFNPDGTWSSVPAEKCFDTRNQPTDCFCKRPVW